MVVRPIGDNFAPYAAPNNLTDVIRRFRDRGLPDPLNTAVLESVGIPPSMTAFTLRALVFLGLMDESGNITTAFNQLRKATVDEYPPALAEIVRMAYVHVFTVANPAADDEVKISDAFRIYEPASQRQKMVRLFMGLCAEAGIVAQGSVKKRMSNSTQVRPRPPKGAPISTPPVNSEPVKAPGYAKTVTLRHDVGTVTLSVSVNPIELTGDDRQWFFEIVDRLNEYEGPPKS